MLGREHRHAGSVPKGFTDGLPLRLVLLPEIPVLVAQATAHIWETISPDWIHGGYMAPDSRRAGAVDSYSSVFCD